MARRRAVLHWCRRHGERRGDAVQVRTYRNKPRWYVRLGVSMREDRQRSDWPRSFDEWSMLPLPTRLKAWKRLGAVVDWGNLRLRMQHGSVGRALAQFLEELGRRGLPVSMGSVYRWDRLYRLYPWPFQLFLLVDLRRKPSETDV